MKLYTYPGNFRAFKALIAAQYNGVDIEVPEFKMMEDNQTPEFLAKNPLGKVPLLETSQGCIFESNAIARYIARIRTDTELYGVSFFESGQIDSWIDFCAHELELPATMWFYPIFGYMPFNAAATAKAKEDLKKALEVLNTHLLHRTYLVGDKITLADITIVSALVYPMKMLLDAGFRKPFGNVERWFCTCVNQPEFKAVVGDVPLCKKALQAEGDTSAPAPAPAGKNKGGKKKGGDGGGKKKNKGGKAPAPAPAPKKKALHPLAELNKKKPAAVHIDEWKKTYKNCPHDGTGYKGACEKFWEILGPGLKTGDYSLWHCKYKHNGDNSLLWMTSNAISGFLERTEEIRKYTMGVQAVAGKEGAGNIFISGVWVFRGDSQKHILDCNPDAEYYEWIKLSDTPETRKIMLDIWAGGENDGDTIEGQPYYDSKVFV
jgi:elongation factor 1-gamma